MDRVMILCCFGGGWEFTSDNTESYKGGSSSVVWVRRNTSYDELVDQLAHEFGINVMESSVRLRCVYKQSSSSSFTATESVPSLFITDIKKDGDVDCFLEANVNTSRFGGGFTPLFISLHTILDRPPILAPIFPSLPVYGHGTSSIGSNSISQQFSVSENQVFSQSMPLYENQFTTLGLIDSPVYDCGPSTQYPPIPNDVPLATEVENHECAPNDVEIVQKDRHSRDPVLGTEVVGRESHDTLSWIPPVPSPMIYQCDAMSSCDDCEMAVGKVYADKKTLKRDLSILAMRRNFQFRVTRSTQDRFEARCLYDECIWRIRAVCGSTGGYFQVSRYEWKHSCQSDEMPATHRQAGRRIIGELIQDKYVDPSRVYRPKNIQDDIEKEFGVRISYDKAWNAREVALNLQRGDPIESYNLLPKYCYMLEQENPGSITHIARDELNNFRYLFFALGGCLKGFRTFIRPVIAIDGTFLKGLYHGTLFVAVCLDGNENIYPLAFGIGDSENDTAWEWFLQKLHVAIGDLSNIVFISDRNSSIEKGICSIFPDASHGVCAFHVSCNLKSKFKFKKSNGDQFIALFFLAAKAYRISEFNEFMENMRLMHPMAVKYLEEDVGVHRWARAHFCRNRYNIMTTNIAECVNGVLRHARELPITNLVEHIRNMLQAWFFKRKTDACEYATHLTPWAHVKIEEAKEQARIMRVLPIERFRFVVKDGGKDGIVNLSTKTCSCRAFELDQLPCAHALAAIRHVNVGYNNYCSDYYTTEYLIGAYGEPINPVGHPSDWVFPDCMQFDIVNPPIQRTPCGRRKKQRLPSSGEEIQQKKCSRCKQLGHNRQTCRNPIIRDS